MAPTLEPYVRSLRIGERRAYMLRYPPTSPPAPSPGGRGGARARQRRSHLFASRQSGRVVRWEALCYNRRWRGANDADWPRHRYRPDSQRAGARCSGRVEEWQVTPDRLQEARVVATGYLFAALFFLGGCAFVLGGLVTFGIINGFLLKGRGRAPSKYDIYESGETPLGSAWVQFPLAFYVFALLFVVF